MRRRSIFQTQKRVKQILPLHRQKEKEINHCPPCLRRRHHRPRLRRHRRHRRHQAILPQMVPHHVRVAEAAYFWVSRTTSKNTGIHRKRNKTKRHVQPQLFSTLSQCLGGH